LAQSLLMVGGDMRKLVMLDKDGYLTEVDPKALLREALTLRAYIESASNAEEAIFKYKEKLLPLVNAAINNKLLVPYKGSPYETRLIQEGIEPDLPKGIKDHYFKFLARIKGRKVPYPPGTPIGPDGRFLPDKIDNNGNSYRWVEFED